jgi:TetR/AcrR family transcriptional repressor of lmrAB and yxaGH operons
MTVVIDARTVPQAMTVVIERHYDVAMQANDHTPEVTTGRPRSLARARMVRSAAALIRERGIHGVGLREVVAHSGGPRGSLGRYFPDGKTQLVTEAIDVVISELSAETDEGITKAKTFADAIGAVVAPWRRLLVEYDFALGCPIAATVVDAADNDELRGHVKDLLAKSQASMAHVYARFGASPSGAEEQSTVLLAAIEGALILARARRSIEPLDTVERYFATAPPAAMRPGLESLERDGDILHA